MSLETGVTIYIQAFLTETLDGWSMSFKSNDCTFHPIPRKIDKKYIKKFLTDRFFIHQEPSFEFF